MADTKPGTNARYSITMQIECVQRELKMRKRVYPYRITKGSMTDAFAAREVACMEAVLDTLQAVRAKYWPEAQGDLLGEGRRQ
jgi:hypothetical protein